MSSTNSAGVTNKGAIFGRPYDRVDVTYPSGTQEVFTYKLGGSTGNTIAVVTINYTDSTKANILNIALSGTS